MAVFAWMSNSSTAGRKRRCGRTSSSGRWRTYSPFRARLRPASQVRCRLASVVEQAHIAKQPTANIEAYDLYLRSQRMRRRREANEKAMEMLRRAINLDPSFAGA